MVTNNSINTNIPIEETKGGTAQSTYTTGNILYASASNTLSKLAIGTVNGSPLGVNAGIPTWLSPNQYLYQYDDFTTSVNGTVLPPYFNTYTQNTGTTTQTGGTAANPGGMVLSTLTNTAGGAGIRMAENNTTGWPFILGGGTFDFFFRINLNALSDATDTYTLRFGLMNANAFSAPTDGVYFTYTATASPTNWQINCTKSGAGTSTADSGVAVAAGSFLLMQIQVNAAASSVAFLINGTQVTNSPITGANIPNVNRLGPACHIVKSAGTGARTVTIDQYYLLNVLTASR